MDVSLVMVKADGSSKDFKLDREAVVIGREEGCRLRIPVPSVSRKHCEVRLDDDEVVVSDLGSSNGTYVNGKRTKRTELAPGDLLCVGPVVFVIRIDGHPREIDAKDSYAAGSVVEDSDESGHAMPSPGGSSAPQTRTAPATPKAGKGEDLSDLLKDFDFGEDEDDQPPKPAPGAKK